MSIFPLQRFTVFGNSMLPTLKPGQNILVFNWAYIFSQPKIGDMVIVQSPDFVEDARQSRRSKSCLPAGRFKVQSEIIKRVQKVKGDKVYLIGDNKEESTDSRNFGMIKKSAILGKVIFVR